MVCNVNGPDGFLTIRDGPGYSYSNARALNRLANVVLNISQRQGRRVKVLDAYPRVSKDGNKQAFKRLAIQGRVDDGYFCTFSE